jgi:hypothetical protein
VLCVCVACCVVLCCVVLRGVVLCCVVLGWRVGVVLGWVVLSHLVLSCRVLCFVLWCCVVLCCVMLCCVVLYRVVLCCAVLCCAMREVRGAYRKPGQGLDEGYVTVPKDHRYSPAPARTARIAAGVGNGKVLMWTALEGKWTGEAAADMYKGPLLKALRKAYPSQTRFTVLEDNDPTGFKSSKGDAAKRDAHIQVFQIPARSPELNVCDYALWKEVTRRMRKQERKWAEGRRENREEYIARLRCVVLCCAVLCCAVLRCVALRRVALRCVAFRCIALRCVALRCAVLRSVALRCVVLR